MPENFFSKIRNKCVQGMFSTSFRTLFLAGCFFSLMIIRHVIGSFGASLEYFYVILVALGGFWFGIFGGIITALVATSILFLELHFLPIWWSQRSLLENGIFFKFFVYLTGGITIGYFSSIEKQLKEKLRALVWEDELTGCVNFRWSMQLLENEIDRCKRYRKELTIIMMDIDHFKQMNDEYGHLVGNDILAYFANIVKSNVRKIDIVSRYGGDEFLVILPEVGSEQALVVLGRIRAKLSTTKIPSENLSKQLGIFVKFSAGVATYPHNGNDMKELVAIADDILYRAKRQGKDQIAVERRRCVRLRPLVDFNIELGDKHGKDIEFCEIVNISQRGMLLTLPQDILKDDFSCRLHFPEEDKMSKFTCKVAHKSKSENGLCRVGVYFVDTPADFYKRLSHYLESPKALHLSI